MRGRRHLDFRTHQRNHAGMENPVTTPRLIAHLASKQRVVMLGGLAIVSHGLARPTFDADIWLDPLLTLKDWCTAVLDLKKLCPHLKILALAVWTEIPDAKLADIVERDGAIRISGATQPIDVFRCPNEIPIAEFESAWMRSLPLQDGTRLPDEIDLLMTKQLTGRDKDMMDIAFLENKAEKRYIVELQSSSAEKAIQMLQRFLTPRVAEQALSHPDAEVRTLALRYLRELANDNDPFAAEILKSIA